MKLNAQRVTLLALGGLTAVGLATWGVAAASHSNQRSDAVERLPGHKLGTLASSGAGLGAMTVGAKTLASRPSLTSAAAAARSLGDAPYLIADRGGKFQVFALDLPHHGSIRIDDTAPSQGEPELHGSPWVADDFPGFTVRGISQDLQDNVFVEQKGNVYEFPSKLTWSQDDQTNAQQPNTEGIFRRTLELPGAKSPLPLQFS
jgi:hypothetical protein